MGFVQEIVAVTSLKCIRPSRRLYSSGRVRRFVLMLLENKQIKNRQTTNLSEVEKPTHYVRAVWCNFNNVE